MDSKEIGKTQKRVADCLEEAIKSGVKGTEELTERIKIEIGVSNQYTRQILSNYFRFIYDYKKKEWSLRDG